MALAVVLLAAPLLLSAQAWAQPTPGAAEPVSPEMATPAQPADDLFAPREQPRVMALRDQANFWLSQNNPESALSALRRALLIEPRNVEVLLLAHQAAARMGSADATTYLDELRGIAPNDPRVRQAERALSEPAPDAAALADARTAARAGRHAEAIQRYRALFSGSRPPASLAVEYYEVLAGVSDAGYLEARTQLGAMAQRLPTDTRVQLAYAQLETYREDTRMDGIERLKRLARVPSVANAARTAWRQALLYLGPDPAAVDGIETYLQTNPPDQELTALLTEARSSMIAPGGQARLLGWANLQSDRGEAERQFALAIADDPNDAEAVIGMAVLRQAQGRLREARELRDRALVMMPGRRDEFLRMMGSGAGTVAGGPSGGGAAPFSNATAAWRSLTGGDLDRAETYARRAIRVPGDERAQGEVVLGQIALRRHDLTGAEVHFRAALAVRRRLATAQAGLYETLQGQGRLEEADAFRRETSFTPSQSVSIRANALQEQAAGEDDPAAKIRLLREALLIAPSAPWIRSDLVRALRQTGATAEAQEIEAQLDRDTSPDGVSAAAWLATTDDRPRDAVRLLEAVPARLRTSEMNQLLGRSRRAVAVLDLERQARTAAGSQARGRLLEMASARDPSGSAGAEVVAAFGRLDDGQNAVLAAQRAMMANPAGNAELRLALAGSLIGTGQTEEAERMLAPLAEDARLSERDRRQLATLTASATATRAGRLSERGDVAGAYRALVPALRQRPDDPLLNAALMRLYVANQQPEDARIIAARLLARDPHHLEARITLADLATSRRDFPRAEQLLSDGKRLHPADVQLVMAEARLARMRGDMRRAERLLNTAAQMRATELRSQGKVLLYDTTLSRGGASATLPPWRSTLQ